jgi:ABC-2 type transport system permease protein
MSGPLAAIVRTEFLLYMREPSAFFFTLIFPLMMLMLFGSIWGNSPFDGADFGYIDTAVPAFIGMVISTSGIMGLATSMAAYREKGILRRFRASPLSPLTVLLGELGALMLVTLAGVILLILAGVLVFGMQFRGSVPEVLPAMLLSVLSISAVGFVPASLASTARGGMIVANVIYFPMLFLSGAVLYKPMLPDFLQVASMAFPLTYVIELLQGLWLGGHLTDYPLQIGVLAGVTVLCSSISIRFFRWE